MDDLEEEAEKDYHENIARLKANREEFMEVWDLVLDTVDDARWLLDHC